MKNPLADSIAARVVAMQDGNGCWNVLKPGDKYYLDFNYYVPKYKSTLWTLVLLADIGCDYEEHDFLKPLAVISDRFLDRKAGIFSLGKSHFPIPCLNGNMLYLHSYFRSRDTAVLEGVIDFFAEYQRFDDGNFKTPSSYPYFSNRSCYGKHTCYWGIVKLLKGLSFLPKNNRSKNARRLIRDCVDFILLHDVCYNSRHPSSFLQKNIDTTTFPTMYWADYLEILWLLAREKVRSPRLDKALDLLKGKMKPDGSLSLERRIPDTLVPISASSGGNEFVTKRAREVMGFYG